MNYSFEAIFVANFLAKGKTIKIVGNAMLQATIQALSQILTKFSTIPRFIKVIAPDIIKLIKHESKNV